MNKICNTCNIEKPLDLFYKDRKSKDGFRNNCKTCQDISRSIWSEKNKERSEQTSKIYRKRKDVKERRNSYQKEWRKNNLYWELWYKAKKRSIDKSLPFDIEPKDIKIPSHCPILGIELFITENNIGDNSATIDKIFPEMGYIKGNIIVISAKANRIKNNSTIEELEKVYNWYKKQKYE
jgi:hypothetical protein